MIFILLKKEFNEFYHDIYSISGILMALFLYKLFEKLEIPYNFYSHCFVCSIAVGQYMFSSLINDLKNKGLLYALNLKAGFIHYFSVKMLFAFLLFAVCLLCHPSSLLSLKIAQIVVIPLAVVLICFMVFGVLVLTHGAEMSSGVIELVLFIGVFFALSQIKSGILQIVLLLFLDAVFLIFCKHIFYSCKYRSQIK